MFPSSPWSRLQVDLLGKVLTVHVDCHRGVKVKLRQGLAGIPPDAHLYFGDSRRHQPGLEVNELHRLERLVSIVSVRMCRFGIGTVYCK